ncbi:isochorismatase family protein [Saccharopolyspora sp. NPDC003752]
MSASAVELYRERGIGAAQRPIRRPALIVVDFTLGFTDRSCALGCDADEAVEETARLLAAARAVGVPRVFTKIEYDEAAEAIAEPFLEKIPALRECAVGSRWSQLDERVAPEAGEPVLRKLFASGFFGTDLAAFLAGQRCDGVIVTGATTSGCVRATVVDAMQHGYRVLVPRTAVVDRAVEPHEAALFDIQAKYGEVTAAAAAEAVIRGADQEVRA